MFSPPSPASYTPTLPRVGRIARHHLQRHRVPGPRRAEAHHHAQEGERPQSRHGHAGSQGYLASLVDSVITAHDQALLWVRGALDLAEGRQPCGRSGQDSRLRSCCRGALVSPPT